VTTLAVTGTFLVALPIAYNLLYTLLARSFDYPDILRRPTGEVLERFDIGGPKLMLTWWGFAMSAVLLAPTAVLVSATLGDANPAVLSLATTIGVLAALVQFLGLIRWPFAVPHLARTMGDPGATTSTKEAVDVTFQTLNRYLGVAVGEHLGYMLTGFWTGLVGIAVIQSDLLNPAFGVIGLVLAPLFLVASTEFLGANEKAGWKFAGTLVPVAYIGWSLWLLALGIALLVK
jgi:Domain of unknown function (DUF4386)